MTRDDEMHNRRQGRLEAAAKTRDWGSYMMFAGGLALAASLTAFALATNPEIPSWVRQTILTAIAILFSCGAALHAVGRASRRTLAQQEDDREEQEARAAARHEELMTELRAIKRNQTFLMARPGAAGAPGALYEMGPDTIDMVRRYRLAERVNGTAGAADVIGQRDEAWQNDVAEAYRLGQKNPPKNDDPPQTV